MRVFVDMDGVLVNLNKAAASTFGLKYPSNSVLGHDWLLANSKTSVPEFLDRLEANPHLWEQAEPYPWTSKIVQMLDLKTPQWMILTSATHAPACWSGKVKWIRRYLTDDAVFRVIMVGGQDKARLASRGDLLIDDKFENVKHWNAAGGVGFHWIDYSEDLLELVENQLGKLNGAIDQHVEWNHLGRKELTPRAKALVS